MVLWTVLRETSVRSSEVEEQMVPQRKTPKTKSAPAEVAASSHPPFTRLADHCRATAEDFERERMGIAAKE